MRRYLLLNLFILGWVVRMFATPQSPDILIYNGDTIPVYSLDLPIYFYNEDYTLLINLFGQQETCSSSDCGRGYNATWEITDNQLYLTGIYSCCYYDDSIKADLNIIFKDKLNNGKVKADWITGNAFSPQGKLFKYLHDQKYYEYELEFTFNKGNLIETRLYDNTKFNRTSIFCQDQEKLNEFIYSNIRWDILPQADTTVLVLIKFIPDENGKIENVELFREDKVKEIYNQEAVRVVKLIPEWDVYFFKEKAVRMVWIQPISFSKENREKYRK